MEAYIFRACEASGWINSRGWAALGGILSRVREEAILQLRQDEGSSMVVNELRVWSC